jgi:hypothetical protein
MSVKLSAKSASLYRHGDVLVSAISELPAGAEKQTHLVLAEGEITGHAHRISERGAAELFQFGADTYLRVVAATATLVHEEHGPIALPTGVYRVWRQREYSPREIRIVRD